MVKNFGKAIIRVHGKRNQDVRIKSQDKKVKFLTW